MENAIRGWDPKKAAQYNPASTGSQLQTIDKFDKTKLTGNFADMYKSQMQQTQTQNAQTLNNANRKASQQAALKGWNPAVAASYVNQTTAGAYDANQQANQNLMNSEMNMKQQQEQEHDQKVKGYIESLKEKDPRAYDAIMRAYLTGGSLEKAASSYINADTGELIGYSKEQQALAERKQEYDTYLNALKTNPNDSMAREYLIANSSQQQLIDNLYMFGKLSQNEIKMAGDKLGGRIIANTESAKDLQGKDGDYIIYEGKLYIIGKTESKSHKAGDRTSTEYKAELKDPSTGKVVKNINQWN